MRRVSRRDFLVGAGTLAALSTLPAGATFAEGQLPKHVILVHWDGFDPDYLGRVPTPNLDVVPNGVRIGDFTLRGNAATEEAKGKIKAADDLDALRASEKLGDLVAEAKPPWSFALSEPEPGQERGSHGSLSEIGLSLLLAGAGVRRGVPPEDADLADVAPSIAHLLNVRPPADAQGRALTESLGVPGARGR